MAFDVAAGGSQAQLNEVASSIYRQLYPNVFTGSVPVTELNLTVAYDVQASPQIDLSPPGQEQRRALAVYAREATSTLSDPDSPAHAVLAALVGSDVLALVSLPQVKITLTTSDQKSTEITIAATATCHADIDASTGQAALTALQVAVPTFTDPTVTWVLANVVSPELLKLANQALSGVRLPSIHIAGVELSPPIVVVQDGVMVALTTLRANGTPTPPPSGTPWPPAAFFTLLSTQAVDAAAAYQVAQLNPHFNDSGSQSWSVFKVGYRYNLTLGNPQIGVSGSTFGIELQLAGGAGASLSADLGIWNPSVDFGVGFTTNPNPGGALNVSVDGSNRVILAIDQVNAFGVAVNIPSLPDWANVAIAWVTSVISNAFTSVLVPAVNAFIGSLRFSVYQIPTVTLNVPPLNVTVVPSQIAIGSFGGMLCASGTLQVNPA